MRKEEHEIITCTDAFRQFLCSTHKNSLPPSRSLSFPLFSSRVLAGISFPFLFPSCNDRCRRRRRRRRRPPVFSPFSTAGNGVLSSLHSVPSSSRPPFPPCLSWAARKGRAGWPLECAEQRKGEAASVPPSVRPYMANGCSTKFKCSKTFWEEKKPFVEHLSCDHLWPRLSLPPHLSGRTGGPLSIPLLQCVLHDPNRWKRNRFANFWQRIRGKNTELVGTADFGHPTEETVAIEGFSLGKPNFLKLLIPPLLHACSVQ